MKNVKKIVTGSLVSACTLAASSAMALDYNNGGNQVFTTKFSGPTIAISGSSLACTSTFTLAGVTGTGDTVTSATFTGAGCATIRPVGLPWGVSAPTSQSGVDNVVLTGVQIFLPMPINKTCTGTVTGSLNGSAGTVRGLSPGQFTFIGTLAASTGGNCIVKSNLTLTSSPIVAIN